MKLKCNIDEVGRGTIFLESIDLSNNVAGISIDAGVGKVTEIRLHLKNIETEGIVKTKDTEIREA